MASEIKVDTISEKTSANGVTIDSLGIKDGKITNLMNATLSAADLGGGLHVKTADSSAATHTSADELVLENSGHCGISVLSATDATGNIYFNDSGGVQGYFEYNHDGDKLSIGASGSTQMTIGSGLILAGTTSTTHPFHFATNKDSEYGFYYQNDGNASTRDGVKLASGSYAASGTNYAILFATGNNTTQGSITFSGGTVSYNAFTASHEVSLPTNSDGDEWGTAQTEANKDGYAYGTLVKTHSIYYQKRNEGSSSTSDELERGIRYNVSNATTSYGRDVLGVYSGKANPRTKVDNKLYVETDQEVIDGDKNVGDIKTWGSPEESQNIHYVHVLGDGHILCNNEKGNIAVGDGITCSSTAGIGMKADKTCMIIGMAQEAVTFSNSTPKLVAVQYGIRQFTPWTD